MANQEQLNRNHLFFQLKCSRDEYHPSDSGKMTFALKFVFLLLLELCAFVEYDLGKFRTFTNHFRTRLAVS